MSLVNDGSGTIGARLVIEGLDYEFVTDAVLAGSGTHGRLRVEGLKLDGLVIGNSSDMVNAKVAGQGLSIKIDDFDEIATKVFARTPALVTYLGADFDVSVTTCDVDNTTGWPSSGVFHVGTECIAYSSKNSGQFLGCTRAYRETIEQAHYVEASGNNIRPEIVDTVVSMEGRRAYLYVYDDATSGDGVLRFRGVVSRDAKLSGGTTWSLSIDPITRALEANIGDDLTTPPKIRGIYYPWNCGVFIGLTYLTGPNATDSISSYKNDVLCGFFETQTAFVNALNAKLTSMASGWFTTVQAYVNEGGGWGIRVITSGTARWVTVQIISGLDPAFITLNPYPWVLNPETGETTPTGSVSTNQTYLIAPRLGDDLTLPSSSFVLGDGQPGMVPRAGFGSPSGSTEGAIVSLVYADRVAYPQTRLYLDSPGVSSLEAFTIASSGDREEISISLDPAYANVTDRTVFATSVQVGGLNGPYGGIGWRFRFFGSPELTPVRVYMTDIYGSVGFASFLDYVILNSRRLADIAALPLVSSVFASGYATVIREAQANGTYARRRYYHSKKKAKFDETMTEELKLLGLFPRLNLAGEIEFKKLELLAPTSSPTWVVDGTSELVTVEWSTWERNAFGTVNEVRMLTGYDSNEDKFTGPIFRVIDLESLARNKTPRVVEIKPKSTSPILPTVQEMKRLSSTTLGVFGRSYAIATVTVPWTLFPALCGDSVLITSTVLPAASGVRGAVNVQGIITSKSFTLGEAHGTIEVLIHYQNIAGYTPTCLVASQSGATTAWTVTINTSTTPFEANTTRFPIGTRVRACRWNSPTTTADRSGVVTGTTTNTISITFDSAWTPSTSTWVIDYDLSSSAGVTAAQLLYAYVGNDTSRIALASGDIPARTFAP